MKLLVFRDHDSILVVCNRFSKILYFIVIIIVEGLMRLFRNNVWKLHRLLENVILDRDPQFVAELINKLNKMLRIETKLLTAFYQQTNRQTEKTNQELEQYLKIYIDQRKNNQLEQIATAEFAFNNKVYITTKSSLFRVNYRRELRISFEIRRTMQRQKNL